MSDDYTWPADPRLPRLLALFAELHSDVCERVRRAPSVEVRDALLLVLWRIDAATERAKQRVQGTVALTAEPVIPRTPLDPGWAWQDHEGAGL